MAGRAITPTTGITNFNEWQDRQKHWLLFVQTGGPLQEVPILHRRDQVCFYASMTGSFSFEKWATDILPHIPLDVLHMGFITGNIGHKIYAEQEQAEQLRGARISIAHQERLERRSEQGRGL